MTLPVQTYRKAIPKSGSFPTQPSRPMAEKSLVAPRDEFRPNGLDLGGMEGSPWLKLASKFIFREVPTRGAKMSEEEKQQILEKIQPGDVLLMHTTSRPNLAHLEYLVTGTNYTHCAIYEGRDKFLEANGAGVDRASLTERLDGPIQVSVVRPKYQDFKERAAVMRAARNMRGVEYDYKFDNSNADKVYCTEFIELALKAGNPNFEVPDVSRLGHEFTAPDAFLEMKDVDVIHEGKADYWKNRLEHWPLSLGGAVGAGVGALLGGPIGALAGAVLGYEAGIGAAKLLKS